MNARIERVETQKLDRKPGVPKPGKKPSRQIKGPSAQRAHDCSASKLALPPTAAVLTLTACSSAKRAR
jgi:hypothetical protein